MMKGNDSHRRDHADGDVEHVIAQSLFLFGVLACDQRLIVRTEDFAQ
jgi:hypothetical protein